MPISLHGKLKRDPSESVSIPYDRFNFSAGEVHVRLPSVEEYGEFTVKILYPDSEEIIESLLLIDAIKRSSDASLRVVIPYLPYSRQDRACFQGESLSLKVFFDTLKSNLNDRDEIITWDVHNPGSNVFRRKGSGEPEFVNIEVDNLIESFKGEKGFPSGENTLIIPPDEGAIDRAEKAALGFGLQVEVLGKKIRDPGDGKITGTALVNRFNTRLSHENSPASIKGKDILIVDDICDGGRTFIELAKEIWKYLEPSSVSLYVTHGIFSKGLDVFLEDDRLLIERIYTANLFPGVELPVEGNPFVPAVYTLK